MQCTSPIYLQGYGHLPCGRCMACRIARTREWGERIMHELLYFDKASFVTLTYDPAHLPEDNGLHKDHYQLFVKRLRKAFTGRLIKYYACGEYGSQFGRPHYHAILFGVGLGSDADVVRHCWGLGFVKCGSVTQESARYVSGYIKDKLNGEMATKAYGDRFPPFQLCSQGIGKRFLFENKDQIIKSVGYTVKGIEVGMPRYYRKLLGDSYPKEEAEKRNVERANKSLQLSDERGQSELEEWKRRRERARMHKAEIDFRLKKRKF